MITEKDGLKHKPYSDDECVPGHSDTWQESLYFGFRDAEKDIWGITRIGLEPNLKTANSFFIVTKGGEVVHRTVKTHLPIPEADWDDISLAGVTYKIIEPLKKFRLMLDVEEAKVDVVWDGFTEVFDYRDNKTPVPNKLAGSHYEQTGEVTGSVIIRGERFDIRGYGQRDHSWGRRDFDGIENWWWMTGIFGKECSFNTWSVLCDGKRTHSGYIFDGKRNIGIVDAQIELEFEADGSTPKGAQLRLTDEKGGTLEATAEAIIHLPAFNFGKIGQVSHDPSIYRMKDKVGFGIIEYEFQRK